MAIQKSIELPSGITASYWKIIFTSFNYMANNISLRIAGYATQQTREDEKTPVVVKTVEIAGDDYTNNFTTFTDDPRKNIYEYLQNTESSEFYGGTNI